MQLPKAETERSFQAHCQKIETPWGWYEVGTVYFGGKPYESMGALLDNVKGRAVVYPGSTEETKGKVLGFDGAVVGYIQYVNRSPARWQGNRWIPPMYNYRCVIDGAVWYGRGQGQGCILRLKRGKQKGEGQ